MNDCIENKCNPRTCTTGIHIDINTRKVLNPCVVCKIVHDDPKGTYRIMAVGANGTECILQESQGEAKFVYKKNITPPAIFTNETWTTVEDLYPPIDELFIVKDKANGDIYAGKCKEDGWFSGKHVNIGSFILGPVDRFVWKHIKDLE